MYSEKHFVYFDFFLPGEAEGKVRLQVQSKRL